MTTPDPKAISDADLIRPFPGRPSRRLLERLLLALLLLGLLALKLRYHAGEPAYGPDASLYHDIAAHVRDGRGVVTDVSLFNAGFREFPHPTAVYPLWPLLLGLCARVVPLDLAALWLPTLLYFGAIVLAYRLAHRVLPEPLFPETWPVIHAGHLAACVLALTNAMFFHTSRPYTEGLGFFLLLLAMTRAERFLREPLAWRGLEVGAWLGLVILARSQLALAAAAMLAALAWAVLRLGWRRWLGPALACAAGLGLVLAAQLAHFATFMDDPRPAYLLRFDLYREPSALRPLQVMVETEGPWAWLRDRARGVPIAFGAGPMSYFHCFGLWSLGLLGTLPFLALDVWRALRERRLAAALRWLHDPKNMFAIFFALLAAAGVLSLHAIHKAMFTPWNFGTRHALTAGFAMFAGLVYLARRPVLGRVLALFSFCAATYFGFWRIDNALREPDPDRERWTLAANADIAGWLEARARTWPGLVVAAQDIEVQKLARYTEGVGYHWISGGTTWAELRHLIDDRGVRYVILRDDTARRMRVTRDAARFAETFTAAARRSGYTVYRLRGEGDPAGELPAPPPARAKEPAEPGGYGG